MFHLDKIQLRQGKKAVWVTMGEIDKRKHTLFSSPKDTMERHLGKKGGVKSQKISYLVLVSKFFYATH